MGKNRKRHSNASSRNSSRTESPPTTSRKCTPMRTPLSALTPHRKRKKPRRSPKRDGQRPRCPRPRETTVFVRRRSLIFALLPKRSEEHLSIHLSYNKASWIIV